MSEQRGRKAVSSFVFKFIEGVGMQVTSFVVSLVLANLLLPGDYGVLSMLTVFVALCQVFVQSGLGTALIRQKEVDDCDSSSVFYVSLAIAVVMYALLFVSAPFITAYFEMPELKNALRVLALVLFPGAMLSVQTAMVARQMAFRRQMLVSLTATVLSGAVGIGMAVAGMGYWALVGQQMTNQFAQAILMLFFLSWKPKLLFSLARVRVFIRFGWKLLVSSLLDTGYANLRSAVIGKKYTQDMLGLYTRGKQFPELLMNAVNGSISSVLLPVLSEYQDDVTKLKAMMRRGVMTSSFLVLPLMAGLMAVAEPLITLLLPDAWLPCVPFLQIMAIDFAFYPIHTSNLQAINALGRSDVFLKLELIKKLYGIAILAVTVFCFGSVYAIAWGAVVSTLVSAFVNAAPNQKLLGYGYFEQMKDIFPSLLLSAVMFLIVNAMNALPWHPALLMLCQMAVGAAVYGGLALALKLESAKMLLNRSFR